MVSGAHCLARLSQLRTLRFGSRIRLPQCSWSSNLSWVGVPKANPGNCNVGASIVSGFGAGSATPAAAPEAAHSTATMARPDHSSLSNCREAVVRHSHFELDVNFDTTVIEGYAHLHVEAAVDGPSQLLLDTRDLAVHSVTLQPSGRPLQHSLGTRHKVRSRCRKVWLARIVIVITRCAVS
eukprot:GHRQ01021275.1.p1 GENE.GHRQ01021275.1~~GHRQ01021275.1.p1  ORF type:complete len:181 (+),score=39.21 GHRQ01021275.1:121-663(+)